MANYFSLEVTYLSGDHTVEYWGDIPRNIISQVTTTVGSSESDRLPVDSSVSEEVVSHRDDRRYSNETGYVCRLII